MAYDAQIEMFAYDVFHTLYLECEIISHKPDIFDIYGEEVRAAPEYSMASHWSFEVVIRFRFDLFFQVYFQEIIDDLPELQNSSSEFNNYIQRSCDRVDWFGNLTVFDRMFATCAFVWNLCYYCYFHRYPPIEWAKYSHICWAMYFDKYADEFYACGGWFELLRVAKSYVMTNTFNATFPNEPFPEVNNAVDCYTTFKKVINSNQRETVSKSWIKFNIEQLRSCENIYPLYDPKIEQLHTVGGIEKLLQRLKHLCNPSVPINSILAPDSIIETRSSDEDNKTASRNDLSLPIKEKTTGTEITFKRKDISMKSDSFNFSSSVRSREIPLCDAKMTSNLFGADSSNPNKFACMDFNNSNRPSSLKDLEHKAQVKSHNESGSGIDVLTEKSTFPLDAHDSLRNVVQLTEKIRKNEVLNSELGVETPRTREESIFANKKVSFEDIGADCMENISTSKKKPSNKGGESQETHEMIKEDGGKVSSPGDFRTDAIENNSTSKNKLSVERSDIQRKSEEIAEEDSKMHGDATTEIANISKKKKKKKRSNKSKEKQKTIEEESNEIKDILRMILVLGNESEKHYMHPKFQKPFHENLKTVENLSKTGIKET